MRRDSTRLAAVPRLGRAVPRRLGTALSLSLAERRAAIARRLPRRSRAEALEPQQHARAAHVQQRVEHARRQRSELPLRGAFPRAARDTRGARGEVVGEGERRRYRSRGDGEDALELRRPPADAPPVELEANIGGRTI